MVVGDEPGGDGAVQPGVAAGVVAGGEWDIVGLGDAGKQGMVSDDPDKGRGNQKINRAVQNNWPLAKYRKIQVYKLEYRGKLYMPVDEHYSTQECNECGHRIKLDPSTRVYRCPKCNMEMGRDENSAINLLNAGLDRYVPQKDGLPGLSGSYRVSPDALRPVDA